MKDLSELNLEYYKARVEALSEEVLHLKNYIIRQGFVNSNLSPDSCIDLFNKYKKELKNGKPNN